MLILLSVGSLAFNSYPEDNLFNATRVYHLNGSGTDSLGRQDGVNNGGLFESRDWTNGTGLTLDGVNDFFDTKWGSHPVDNISMCAPFAIFMRIESRDSTTSAIMFTSREGSTADGMIADRANANLGIRFSIGNNNEGNEASVFWSDVWDTITTGNNQSVLIQKSAGCTDIANKIRLYINGTNVTGLSVVSNPTLVDRGSTKNVTFGSEAGGSIALNATFDDIIIFNHTLTDAEILTLHQGNFSAFEFTSPHEPLNNSIFTKTTINFNVSFSSSSNYDANLFINGTLNQTRSFLSSDTFISFNVTLSDGHISYKITANTSTQTVETVTNLFIIDTINPFIIFTFPSPNDDTKLNNLTLNTNILLFNINLKLFEYNLTDPLGNRFFNTSENLTGSSSFTITNAVSLSGLAEGPFSARVKVCDIADICTVEAHTFVLDLTSPTILNLDPVNNSVDTDGDITFSFSTTEDGTCSLLKNSVVQQSKSVLNGTDSFNQIFTADDSFSWNIRCSDLALNNATSGAFLLNISFPVIPPGLFTAGNCPNGSLSDSFTFAFIGFFIILLFIVNEIFIKVDVLNVVIGIGLVFFGLVIGGCSVPIGWIVILFGIVIMLFSFIKF